MIDNIWNYLDIYYFRFSAERIISLDSKNTHNTKEILIAMIRCSWNDKNIYILGFNEDNLRELLPPDYLAQIDLHKNN